MKEKTTLTATVAVWLSSSHGPDDLLGDEQRAVSTLTLYEPYGEASKRSWQQMGFVYVGEADVTVRLIDAQGVVASKVESLRAEQGRVLAEAQARATSIEVSIQKLLAIAYEAPEVAA